MQLAKVILLQSSTLLQQNIDQNLVLGKPRNQFFPNQKRSKLEIRKRETMQVGGARKYKKITTRMPPVGNLGVHSAFPSFVEPGTWRG